MKIGIDFRMGGNINSGIGRYTFELLKALLEIDKKNKYYVFYNELNVNQEDLKELTEKENVFLVPTKIRHYSAAEQVKFFRVLSKEKLDLVHFPNFNVPVLYRGNFVVTIHDMVHHRISGHKKTHFFHFQAYKYIIKQAALKASGIICPSEDARNEVAKFFPSAAEKISVIHEGVSLKHQTEEKVQKVKKEFLLKRPYFLFVGTLEKKKNIVQLARGFDAFLEKYKLDMDLVFAGKVDKHAPDEKFKAMGIKNKNRLVFTGFIEDDELAALYQGAYAFVSASINEGFGLPGVEAMQWGLPLLVADTAVFNEIYDQAAIYFKPQDPEDIAEKMNLIASDVKFYAEVQKKSLNRSVHFSWKDAAKKTLELYEKVAAPKVMLDANLEAIPEE